MAAAVRDKSTETVPFLILGFRRGLDPHSIVVINHYVNLVSAYRHNILLIDVGKLTC